MRKQDWKVLIFIGAVYFGMELCGITCPILYLTGVSCAGCGMSRAWLSLLHLDVAGAIHYHPLFWLPAVAFLVYLCRKKLPKGVLKTAKASAIAALVVVYIVRMLSPVDTIVVFQLKNGLLFRILNQLGRI